MCPFSILDNHRVEKEALQKKSSKRKKKPQEVHDGWLKDLLQEYVGFFPAVYRLLQHSIHLCPFLVHQKYKLYSCGQMMDMYLACKYMKDKANTGHSIQDRERARMGYEAAMGAFRSGRSSHPVTEKWSVWYRKKRNVCTII